MCAQKFEVFRVQRLANMYFKCAHLETFQPESLLIKGLVNFSFHVNVHNCTLILLFFAQIFGQSMHLHYSCVSFHHAQLSYEGLKVAKINACAHRSYSFAFVVHHSGVQPATQAKILGVHLGNSI